MSERKAPSNKPVQPRPRCPIVGVGASAGGLEAFTQLLTHLPTDTGFGFVLVQHLDPQHESALVQLLARVTSMPVHEVTNNLRVEANHVYIIPPNTTLCIARGILKLQRRSAARVAPRSIDFFLESLANDQGEQSIGVILSGTATDGTKGLEAIKAAGGLTFAQDESARYDSMPRNAVAAGCVDLVLSPPSIARELARIARHPLVAKAPRSPGRSPVPPRGAGRGRGVRARDGGSGETTAEEGYKKILLLLRNHTGVDFSFYKPATIHRRIARRTVLKQQASPGKYADFLKGNVRELDALFVDALINVTSFFRNPAAFAALKQKVLGRLVQQRSDEPVRAWVLGCSTGQEAYSIAMAFAELAEKNPRTRPLQVFATDLNEANLEKARHGLYPKTIVQDMSPERLRRFFVEEEGGFRVIKALREQVVFARHNLINDPPFSRMDLISCRNLMIYLEPNLQKKALHAFHYALKPDGALFLGSSESIGAFTELFGPVDKKHRLYAKKPAPTVAFHLPVRTEAAGPRPPGRAPRIALPDGRSRGGVIDKIRDELSAEREADRLTVNQFAPPSVLIDGDLQILQFRGPTGAYLEPPMGKARFDLLKMARSGLMLPLRAAVNRARKGNRTVRKAGVRLHENGRTRVVDIEVVPLKNLKERRFLILFGESAGPDGAPTPGQAMPLARPVSAREESGRIAALEVDLSEARDYLQSIQEQQEGANEELQAANEEGQSANEELQSLNEELETSKEELESTNEELTTVNEEMSGRNAELSRLNSDLTNLETSTNLVVVLLGRNLVIRRFSAQAGKQFNLEPGDVGRPISRVRHNLLLPELEDLIAKAIAGNQEFQREVQAAGGHWYSLRVRPYLTVENKADGAVLVLTDIDDLKKTARRISEAHAHTAAIIRTVYDPLVILSADLHLLSANEAFYRTFKLTPAATKEHSIFTIAQGAWNLPRLRRLLKSVVSRHTSFNDIEITHDFSGVGRRSLLLNARLLNEPDSKAKSVLLGMRDITSQKAAADALRASEVRFRALFDLGPVGIYTCDAQGRIQEFNRMAAAMWRRRPKLNSARERYTGAHKQFLPDGTFLDGRHGPMSTVLLGKVPAVQDMEILIERADGSRINANVNIVPVRDELGAITGAINCFYDVTGRKRAEAALRTARNKLANHARQLEETVTRRTAQLSATNERLKGSVESIRQGREEFRSLLQDAQRMQKILRSLTHQILTAQEEERKKISRELHDEVVQNLVGINVELSALVHGNSTDVRHLKDKIARTQRLVEGSVDAVHRFARDLRPTVLDDLGLIPALHAYCKSLAARKKLKIHLTTFAGVEHLASDLRTVLFRVSQEALNNIARHARATRARVSIMAIPGAVRLEISDNGKSFAVRSVLQLKNKRLGLVGMRERVEMVGGNLTIESAPGKGTTVRAEIPF